MRRLRSILARKPEGYRLTIGRVLAVYCGLMATVILASLDQTIVATALPRIVSQIGGLQQYPWVFAAYMLAATVTIPLYGKLGDVYGRRPLLLASISLFLTGSAFCGLAQTMTQLVACRALQGLGAGGLVPLTMATIGRIVPLRDRGRFQGLISAAFAGSSIAGPIAGGFIVDRMSWRWIFYVNLPVGLVAVVVIMLTMPKRSERSDHSIDWPGATALAVASLAFLTGLIWGGRQYPWLSSHVVGSLTAAAAALIAFVVLERRAREPILPFEAMRRRTVAASVICTGLVGMIMFGTITYIPLFVQGVIGTSATSSGLVLTPLLLGVAGASLLSGQLIARTGRLRRNAIAGPVVQVAGLVLLWRLSEDASNSQAARAMVVVGVGSGLMMQVFLLSVQNSVPRAEVGAATALTQFTRSIGSTLGVVLMGVLVNQSLPNGAQLGGSARLGLHRLPPLSRALLSHGLHAAFLAALCISAAVLVIAVLGLEEVALRQSVEDDGPGHETDSPPVIST